MTKSIQSPTVLRHRLLDLTAPLLVNVGAAAALRLILPYTLANSGERYRYYEMALLFPIRECPSFHCFRIVPPMLASLLPLQVADAFLVIGFVFQALAGVMLWLVAVQLHGSKRVALLATLWYWASWGPMLVFVDPLLITDPVQAFWSFGALYLLLTRRYSAAMPLLVVAAAVKETVLLVPMIYALYTFLARDEYRRRLTTLGSLIAIPLAAWFLIRLFFHFQYGYVIAEDAPYVRSPHFFRELIPTFGIKTVALYMFSSFGAGWVLGALGLLKTNRRQRALTAASLIPMAWLCLYQLPERALASFPYAVLIPAAVYLSDVPAFLIALVLTANAAFTIRMNAAVNWLPRGPILLAALAILALACVYATWSRRRSSGHAARSSGDISAAARLEPLPTVSFSVVLVPMLAVVALAAWRLSKPNPVTTTATLDSVVTIDGGTPSFAISRDGQMLAFVIRRPDGIRQLWVRHLQSGRKDPVPQTEDAALPFWSPDATSIGFFADRKLKIVDLATGQLAAIADAPEARGGTWSANGVIIFAPSPRGGLYRVSANGGATQLVTTIDPGSGEDSHRWPEFVEGTDRFLFVVWSGDQGRRGVYAGSLGSTNVVRLSEIPYSTASVPGFLFLENGPVLFAWPFDSRRLQLFGGPMYVSREMVGSIQFNRGAFSTAKDVLVFAKVPSQTGVQLHVDGQEDTELRWLDRRGRILQTLGETEFVTGVELSPDARYAVLEQFYRNSAFVLNLSLDRPLPGHGYAPVRGAVWSADGERLVFARRTQATRWALEQVKSGFATSVGSVVVADLPAGNFPTSWTSDGKIVLYQTGNVGSFETKGFAVSNSKALSGIPRRDIRYPGVQAHVSPDDRWVAYSSDLSSSATNGRSEVYVEPLPPTGNRWQISTDGGSQPRWRRDGKELFFVVGDHIMMAAAVETHGGGFRAATPHALFEAPMPFTILAAQGTGYDVAPDGQRFLVNALRRTDRPVSLTIVNNWKSALKVTQ